MASNGSSTTAALARQFQTYLGQQLLNSRGITLRSNDHHRSSVTAVLNSAIDQLRQESKTVEADAIDQIKDKTTRPKHQGGLEITDDTFISSKQYDEIIFQTDAWLQSIKSKELANDYLHASSARGSSVRPMTLAQKIFTQHALSGVGADGALAVGDVCRVGVDWILASELSWASMAQTYADMGSPGIWRNDRLWIAGDHVVHPDVLDHPKVKAFVETAEKSRKELHVAEFQGMNYTIMHTEFVRERAEPGMLVFGSDSHSCSAGAVGCLSIGCGTADVMMTLSMGETWFKIPESILIEFVGEPLFGISGKDVILHILNELKRNTVAAERIVEFAGPGAKHLSCDARFAICNMCTEFGAITGVFIPDMVTRQYIESRRRKVYRSSSLYFQPDEDAEYAGRFTIDLSLIEPSVAVYPNPDDVVSVSQMAETPLDGVFIGACTTTEEELVLGALVLKVGLARGLPLAKGKRHYVPGSLPIVQKLQELGLLDVYQKAGFTRGPPGCSLCVGLSAEKALEGETWLSSQNRNFENRMGKGSFGHLSSAMVCAASAFSMTITSPAEFLKDVDVQFFKRYSDSLYTVELSQVEYMQPNPPRMVHDASPSASITDDSESGDDHSQLRPLGTIESKIVTLPDFIDTDALAPGPTLTSCKTDEEFGQHVLEHTHPEFRSQVANGHQVVVAGKAFGVGSSREVAVSALKGAGVQAVIARSFAFIYSRNQPSLGMLGIVMEDEDFYGRARHGESIVIDLPSRTIHVGGKDFTFKLSEMEYQLTINRGVANAYNRFGKSLWMILTSKSSTEETTTRKSAPALADGRLEW